MEIITERKGNTLTVKPEGRIDTLTAPKLQTVVFDALGDATEIIIDMAGVSYISSTGLRVMILFAKEMDAREGRIQAIHVNEMVQSILDFTGLLEVLNVSA